MYKVEITASSLEELADKTLALGGRLALASAKRLTAAAPELPQPVAKAAAAAADPWPVEESGLENLPPLSETADPEPIAEVPAAPPVPDYATELAPAVLQYVKVKGKPAARALLERYGALVARDVDTARWAELLNQIRSELAQ